MMKCLPWLSAVCMLIVGLFSGIAAASGEAAAEAEWSQFRGPNGSGVGMANLPVQWTSKDYLWRTTLPGEGHSSPVICGNRLFITAATEKKKEDATLFVCGLDASKGNILWTQKFTVPTHKKNKLTSYASSTPALDQKRVYVATVSPEKYWVIALDQADGHELWRRDLGPFQAEWGFAASPIVFEDLVIVANDQLGPSSIVGLDAKTGNIRWKTERKPAFAAYSTPSLYHPKDGPVQLILCSTGNGISSLDPRTGKVNWELPVFKERVVALPLIAGDLIVASAGKGSGGLQMFAVTPGDPAKHVEAKVAYEIKGKIPYVPISVTDGPHLFMFNDQGIVSCLETASGKLLWQERVGATFFGSPVLVGNRIYCMSRDGKMIVLAASDKYQRLASFDLEEPTQSTPAIANGRMYLRTATHIMAIGKP